MTRHADETQPNTSHYGLRVHIIAQGERSRGTVTWAFCQLRAVTPSIPTAEWELRTHLVNVACETRTKMGALADNVWLSEMQLMP